MGLDQSLSELQRVLHVSVTDGDGGAGMALLRLHRGLISRGVESRVLVGRKTTDTPGVEAWPHSPRIRWRLQHFGQRVGLNDVLLPYGFGLPWTEAFQWASVVHYHNLHGRYFNFLALPLLTRRKPALLTLHDIWAFTGHCAYSFECERWRHGCGACPHLDVYPEVMADRTAAEWRLKAWTFRHSDLELVCTTHAMAELVSASLLQHRPRRIIPHGIDTAVFSAEGRAESRRALEIPQDAFVVLLGAYDLRYPHKGVGMAIRALSALPPQVAKNVFVLAFGHGGEFVASQVTTGCRAIGFLEDDARKPDVYRAANVLLYPTQADSFGLIPLEAVACGTPVIASRLPGLDEVVVDGVSGFLQQVNDADGFASVLADLCGNPDLVAQLSASARAHAVRHYALDRHIDEHRRLYQALASRTRRRDAEHNRP